MNSNKHGYSQMNGQYYETAGGFVFVGFMPIAFK